ncbi:unnamed protein product [Hydatigera taeniaeformis]|uniref:Nucleoplasmin domain-containing protein n=1 Tax=Hydatigena taeniaeformis TaxID=6205 RepID=A0A0R3WUW7_HYDTA|nr:unnamed protein product [Hydatigera taeniaeformis]
MAAGARQQVCHHQEEQKVFAQIGIPVFLTCASDESRPPALLEINFNDEKIALSSRNWTTCKETEESKWQSVRLILRLLIKYEFIVPLSVKCEVKNGEDFTESGPLRKPFEAIASGAIHLHGRI